MTSVYKAITHRGEFVAFWESDPTTMSFFLPSSPGQEYFSRSLDEWNSARSHYVGKDDNDLDLYDDVVNAAWHFLGQGLMFLDKRNVKLSGIEPGTYYPRIWRAYYPQDNPFSGYNAINLREEYGHKYMQSAVAAASLFDYLVEIFRHVEPSDKNYQTFGHKMRELLLLACTEVESAWRAVLEENTRKEKRRDRYTTGDYFRVKQPLRLDDWSVILTDYGHLGPFTPFEKWSEADPTKSLVWYDAYNAVKHNREAEFSKATLENLLSAMAALHIMQAAQWGPEVFSLLHENRFSPFTIVQSPTIGVDEVYMPGIDENRSLVAALYFDR